MNTKKAALTVLSITLKIVAIAVIALGIFRLGSMAFSYGHSVFQEEAVDPMPGRTIQVTVPDGASKTEIAKLLEKRTGGGLEAFLPPDPLLQIFQDYETRYLHPVHGHAAPSADGGAVRGGRGI